MADQGPYSPDLVNALRVTGVSGGVAPGGSVTAAADALRVPVDDRDELAVAGSVSSAATLFTQDMTGYNSVTVQVNSAGTGCTITYETSDDNATWFSTVGVTVGNNGTSLASATTTTAVMTRFPKVGKFFRARVSTYGSGTVTVVGNCHNAPHHIVNSVQSVQGPIAHDAAISTRNAERISGRARTTNYAAVTASDNMADFTSTMVGAQIVKPFSIPEEEWQYAAAAAGIVNTTTAVTFKAAAGAGIRNYITSIQIQSETLGVATEVAIRDGAAGTVIWRTKLSTTAQPLDPIVFASPLKGTANTLLEVVTLTASVTGAVYFNAQGYQAP
jgi:hypothetical protein